MVEQSAFEQLTGMTLGNYRLQKLVEHNKQGPTFLASARTGETLFVRFLTAPVGLAPDARIVYLGRFQQEANQIASLQHPHIMPLLDYGNYQSMPYLVYPHVPLVSLRSLLAQSAATDAVAVGRYLEQIASALEYAHSRAVLHRNLSTNCIFRQSNRQLVVAEFGIARILELCEHEMQAAQGVQEEARQSHYTGSSESCAPEQLFGRNIDAYTDIYALGAVLYRMLTGHPPFAGRTREEISRQHLYAKVPPISTWRSGLPVDLDHIIARAMAKEPAERFRRPSELVRAYYQIVAPDEALRMARTTGHMASVASGGLAAEAAWRESAKQNAVARRESAKFDAVARRESAKFDAVASRESAKYNAIGRNAPAARGQVSRRALFTTLAAGGVGAAALIAIFGTHLLHGASTPQTQVNASAPTAAAPTKAATKPASSAAPATNANVLARTADIPLNSSKTFPIANQRNPGVIVHLTDNRFVAFDSTCTHEQCSVSYNPQDKLLECPCHGAAFDPAKNASVVQGPAQTPLTAIKISVNSDGTITKV